MTRPTEIAKQKFEHAAKAASVVAGGLKNVKTMSAEQEKHVSADFAISLRDIAPGLSALDDGLRATCIALDDIRATLKSQNEPAQKFPPSRIQ